MIFSTVFVASLIAYRFYGIDGACVAAAVAWVAGLAANVGVEGWRDSVHDMRNAKVVSAVAGLDERLKEGMVKLLDRLPRSVRFYDAVLNSLPVESYDLMEIRGPRSQEEWDASHDRSWIILRRLLVEVHGLTTRYVDKCQEELMLLLCTTEPVPKTDKQLLDFVARVRRSYTESPTKAELHAAMSEQWEIMKPDLRPSSATSPQPSE